MKMSKKVSHLVMFSGGASSWAAAKRVIERYGTEGVVLLFADTRIEDDDLYRFLDDAQVNLGVPLLRVMDGRNPWEVMRDRKIIGNSRIDPCSQILKRQLLDRWRNVLGEPEKTTVYVGLDWTEIHRVKQLEGRCLPWRYKSPMMESPYLTKLDILAWMKSEGLKPPRLYALGFPHNNCGGMCIKAGQAQWAHLFKIFPERYRYHEKQEETMREIVGNHSILRKVVNGVTIPLTLKALRESIEARESYDVLDWGGCGCAIE